MRLLLPLLLCVAAVPARAAPSKNASPFAGSYFATVSDYPFLRGVNIDISGDGSISGSYAFYDAWDDGAGGAFLYAEGTASGQVRNDGRVSITLHEVGVLTYSYTPDVGHYHTTLRMTGRLTADANGNLVVVTDDGTFVWYRT